jgi:hypothetical protein
MLAAIDALETRTATLGIRDRAAPNARGKTRDA